MLRRSMRAWPLLASLACESESEAPVRPEAQGAATIVLAGDAMLGRDFNELYEADPGYRAFRELDDAMSEADVIAFNLETTVTVSDDIWLGKNFNFKLDPRHAASAFGSIPGDPDVPRVLSLANNHILDFGVAGLLETLDTLDAHGMRRVGAGANVDEARAPLVITTAAGVTIGFISASSVCSCDGSWAATADSPGMFQFDSDDPSELVDAVRELRPRVDWLVVMLHWGQNWTTEWPIDWMHELAVDLSQVGADVILGTSAHHILPVERQGLTVVLNGTADFIDDYANPHEGFRNDLSILARVGLEPGREPELDIVPLRIEHEDGDHWVHPLPEDDPDYTLVLSAADHLGP
jgi:poly-gamma-glutamate capsule biosynthesis protein CapA/YwtB (metallophosphatase superfamily)